MNAAVRIRRCRGPPGAGAPTWGLGVFRVRDDMGSFPRRTGIRANYTNLIGLDCKQSSSSERGVMSRQPRPLRLAAFVMNTSSHIQHGLWRHPAARQTEFDDIDLWIGLARTLERGRFDAMFFADVVGLYGPGDGDF